MGFGKVQDGRDAMTKETEHGKGYCATCKWSLPDPGWLLPLPSPSYVCNNPESDDYLHLILRVHSCNQYGEEGAVELTAEAYVESLVQSEAQRSKQ